MLTLTLVLILILLMLMLVLVLVLVLVHASSPSLARDRDRVWPRLDAWCRRRGESLEVRFWARKSWVRAWEYGRREALDGG